MITIFLLDIWNNVWPYLLAIAIFIALIVIHEFGHFIAAKICGVRVNEFAVGFGPKIIKKKIGETVYAICPIPLGGYCAMEGEDSESTDDRAFCKKGPLKRLFIVANGAIFNLILGFIIVGITLLPQAGADPNRDLLGTTTIHSFNENAISEQSGLQSGDKILSVNGRYVITDKDLFYCFTNVPDGTLDLVVKRGGEKVKLDDVKFQTEEVNGVEVIKLDFKIVGKKKTFLNVVGSTFTTTLSYGRIVWLSVVDLVTGKYGISEISGPVGITATVGEVAKQNIMGILPIMALITINLGLFNLFPLPALDGGRILFILIELIFRKPVPQKYEGWVHTVGIVVLLGFMLLVTVKDIIALFI